MAEGELTSSQNSTKEDEEEENESWLATEWKKAKTIQYTLCQEKKQKIIKQIRRFQKNTENKFKRRMMKMIYWETRATFYADVLILTSNWSRAEVGALRNAKKEFCESWCFTPTNDRILLKPELLLACDTVKSNAAQIMWISDCHQCCLVLPK